MRSRLRSLTGLLIAAALVPALAGVLACLPVPIGDPERSRIDPALSGLWAEMDGGSAFLVLEPFDTRTWLVTYAKVWFDAEAGCPELEGLDDYEAMIRALETDGTCLSIDDVQIYKAWRSEHGGRGFLTMEPKALLNMEEDATDPFQAGFWLVARIDREGAEHLTLRMIDENFDGFDETPETREAYEEVVARHADDENLYESDSRWQRVREEHIGLFADLLKSVLHSEL